ncbi:MAG TPA: hypothetical protein VIW72_01270, partial [Burkholderiales bacterium]
DEVQAGTGFEIAILAENVSGLIYCRCVVKVVIVGAPCPLLRLESASEDSQAEQGTDDCNCAE